MKKKPLPNKRNLFKTQIIYPLEDNFDRVKILQNQAFSYTQYWVYFMVRKHRNYTRF